MKQLEKSHHGPGLCAGLPGRFRRTHERGSPSVSTAAMCKIRDAGKIRARDRIAVLAALNMAFDLIQKEQQVQTAGPARSRSRRRSRRRPNGCTQPHAGPAAAHGRSPCRGRPPDLARRRGTGRARAFTQLTPPASADFGLQWSSSAAVMALYFLEPMLLSPGLVDRLASVIISRQMNPRPCCPRPPEPLRSG